jgi:hypothetical protein
MRRSLVALTAASTIAVAAVATPTTADARWRGGCGGGRRSAASPLARSSEAPSHGPITRIRITATAIGRTATRPIATAIGRTIRPIATAIRPMATAIRPTATAIRPTGTATHHLITNGTAAGGLAVDDAGPRSATGQCLDDKRKAPREVITWPATKDEVPARRY